MRAARKLLVTAGVLGGLFAAGNVAVERVAESRIAEEAQKAFATSTTPKVDIDGFPLLLNLLQGKIPRATLEGTDVRAQELPIARLRIVLEGVRASLSDLTASKPIAIRKGIAEAEVTGAAIGAYIRSRGEKVTVAVKPGKVVVGAAIRGVGMGFAEGVPKLVGRLLSFTPDRVSVGGRPLSGQALAIARRELAFEVDLPLLPGGVRITGIEYKQDLVVLIARLNDATIDLTGP